MKKRVFAALLAAMSTAALFSACSGGDSGSSSSESSASESSVSTSSAESSASESAETSEETDWAAQAIADRTETEHLVVNWFLGRFPRGDGPGSCGDERADGTGTEY